jgi:hypothetical protein
MKELPISIEGLKKVLVFTVTITVALVTVIFIRFYTFRREKYSTELVLQQYYCIEGYEGKVYKDRLVVYDGDLKIINLYSKTVVKNIEIPGKTVLGFDIYENKVFWSDTRNDKGMGTSQGDLEKGNSDIFMYDLRTDQITQITTDIYMYDINKDRYLSIGHGIYREASPQVEGNFVVWQQMKDLNRNGKIVLMDLDTLMTRNITWDGYNQKRPSISGGVIAWVDERNGYEKFNSLEKDKNGGSDIGIFDLLNNKEIIIEEEGAQTLCSVSPSYIVYTSRINEKESTVQVIKYRRKNKQALQ